MLRRILLFLTASFGLVPCAIAAEFRFIAALTDPRPEAIRVSVRKEGGQQTMIVRLDRPLIVESDGPVSVEAADDRWWFPAVSTSAVAEVPVWPAAELAGEIAVPREESVPDALEAAFEWKLGSRRETAATKCPVTAGRKWRCRLPELTLDLKLSAPGFAPQYVWDAKLSRDRLVTLPSFMMKRGASLAGWVASADKEGFTSGATVRIEPVKFGYGEEDARLLAQTVKANHRGFFQFTGLPAGQWLVTAEAAGRSPSKTNAVDVDEQREATLREPLLLRELVDMEIAIDPPVFSAQERWSIRLSRNKPNSAYSERLGEQKAGADGRMSISRLPAGEYRVEVRAGGSIFRSLNVYAEQPMQPLRLTVDSLRVRGHIRAGGEGLAARLEFYGSGESAKTRSAEDGAFALILPYEGTWRVRARLAATDQNLYIEDVKVRRGEGEDEARVEIEIPGATIRGRVLDDQGQPAAAAIIVNRNNSLVAGMRTTDGAFELVGIPYGPALIEASTKNARSGGVPVIVEDNLPPLKIEMRQQWRIEGWLTTPARTPIGGAILRYSTPQAVLHGTAETGPSGRFVLETEANPGRIDIAIAAPGNPSKLLFVAAPDEDQRLHIVIGPVSGRLIIPSRGGRLPYVEHQGAWTHAGYLLPPGRPSSTPPAWLTNQGWSVELEPGEYSICPTRNVSDGCVKQLVVAGATIVVDTPRPPAKEAKP